MKDSILDYFPFEEARASQKQVIPLIQKAYEDGKKVVILESPVGSGKSAMAMTIARFYGNSHILTPRKALQDQYYNDFKDHVTVMKGRAAYPCYWELGHTFDKSYYQKNIELGKPLYMSKDIITTASGPCSHAKNGKENFQKCMEVHTICPYARAIDVANDSDHIIHNLHGFIYQANFAERFEVRDLLVVDEAHDLEGIVRGFTSRTITVVKRLSQMPGVTIPEFKHLDEWIDWFQTEDFTPRDRKSKEDFEESVDKLEASKMSEFVVEVDEDSYKRTTKFKFTPISIGTMPHSLILSFGKRVLLMSGTIYNKDTFCRSIGIKPDDAHFIRVGSSFPVEKRPIYMKRKYLHDTSHAGWSRNLTEIGISILKILDVYSDVKGIIHVSSYSAMNDIMSTVKSSRLIAHDREDAINGLDNFFKSEGNGVLVSPICHQGVDFKDDRARFQIVTRVPYANTGDVFIHHKVKTDFPWYNLQALVKFGQILGRVNRSESDYGATILLDERFEKFINRNRRLIPNWILEAILK